MFPVSFPTSPERPSSAPLPDKHEPPLTLRTIRKALETLGLPPPSVLAPIDPAKYQASDSETFDEYRQLVFNAIDNLNLFAFGKIPPGCFTERVQEKTSSLPNRLELMKNAHARVSHRRTCLELMESIIDMSEVEFNPLASPREEEEEPQGSLTPLDEEIIKRIRAIEKTNESFIHELSKNTLTPSIKELLISKEEWSLETLETLEQTSKEKFPEALARAAVDEYSPYVFGYLPIETTSPLLPEIIRRKEIYLAMEKWLVGNS